MTASGMAQTMPAAHKPTLGYTVGIIVVAFIGYHLLCGRKK